MRRGNPLLYIPGRDWPIAAGTLVILCNHHWLTSAMVFMVSLMVHHTHTETSRLPSEVELHVIYPRQALSVAATAATRTPHLGSSIQTGVCLSACQQDVSCSSAFVMVDCSVTHTGVGWGGGGGGGGGVQRTHALNNHPQPSTANHWIWQPGACASPSASLPETQTG